MRRARLMWFGLLVLTLIISGCSAWKAPSVTPVEEEEQDVALPLINPSFEDVHDDNPHRPVGWYIWTGGVFGENVTVETTRAVSGARSLALHTADPAINTGVSSEPLPAIPGRTYRASVQAYIDSDAGSTSIYLDFVDADKKRIAATSQPTSTRNQWTTIEVEGVAPEGTAYVSIILYRTQLATGTTYYDDVTLTLLAP